MKRAKEMMMRKLMSLTVLLCFFSAVVAQPAMTEDAAETPVVPSKLVTVYQVTLDQPITLPQCTEQMYWYQNGNEMCLHMDKFHYQGVLAYSGTVAYPKQMQPPKLMGVAFDDKNIPVVVSAFTPSMQQKEILFLLKEQLGEPLIIITKDPSQEGNIPQGIPSTLWYQAKGRSIIAVWDNGYAWALFVGDRGGADGGKLQIGLNRILPEGKLPEHDWLLN